MVCSSVGCKGYVFKTTLELLRFNSLFPALPPCLLLSGWHLFCFGESMFQNVRFPSSMKKELHEVALKQVLSSRLSYTLSRRDQRERDESQSRASVPQTAIFDGSLGGWTKTARRGAARIDAQTAPRRQHLCGSGSVCSHYRGPKLRSHGPAASRRRADGC